MKTIEERRLDVGTVEPNGLTVILEELDFLASRDLFIRRQRPRVLEAFLVYLS